MWQTPPHSQQLDHHGAAAGGTTGVTYLVAAVLSNCKPRRPQMYTAAEEGTSQQYGTYVGVEYGQLVAFL